jgi:hypothetical protein
MEGSVWREIDDDLVCWIGFNVIASTLLMISAGMFSYIPYIHIHVYSILYARTIVEC